MSNRLADRRRELASARSSFSDGADGGPTLHPDVLSSWRRCAEQISPVTVTAKSNKDVSAAWAASPIRRAADLVNHLGELAVKEEYLAAITDQNGQVIWTQASPEMLRHAEKANFTPGSDWSESAAGTNAPGLSLSLDRPTQVFSVEHWCEPVHDWVCYAAPVHDANGAVIGCLDLSSTWDRATSMAQTSVTAIARLLDIELRQTTPRSRPPDVKLKLLGKARVTINGQGRALSPRQTEILAVLALRPDGLSLNELKGHVYGDRAISDSTVKAEISHLRAVLGGAIESRPYRLTIPIELDVLDIYQSAREGNLVDATTTYIDHLLPSSESPLLIDERHSLDVALRTALLLAGDPSELLRFARVNPFDRQIIEVAQARIQESDACHAELATALRRLNNE